MAISVSGINYIELSDCDLTSANGTWDGGNAVTIEEDFYKFDGGGGTPACIAYTVRQVTQYDLDFAPTTAFSISGGKTFRLWFLTFQKMDTLVNDGIQFYCTDGTNTAYWTVLGGDTYPGGWYPISCYTGTTPTSGTLPTGNITSCGLRVNTLTTSKNSPTTFIDHLHLNDGLEIYADDATYDFDDIVTAENVTTNAWGVLRKSSGVFYCAGLLSFGDIAGDADGTDFEDSGKIVVWEDRLADSGNYGITVTDNTTAATQFQLGAKSGSSGISGCVLTAEDTAQGILPTLDCSDTGLDQMKIYGSSFIGFDTMDLPPDATGNEVLNTNFDTCGVITPSTCDMSNCNFISATSDAMTVASTTFNVVDSSFISPTDNAIQITTVGSYDFDNLEFSGTTASGPYDIENTTAGTVTINALNGSNPAHSNETGGGTTVINNSVTLEINGVKTGTEPTNYVRCRIEKTSDGTSLMNEEAQTSYGSSGFYKATESYNYSTDLEVTIIARYKSYLPFRTTGTITSSGLTVTAVWIQDPVYT